MKGRPQPRAHIIILHSSVAWSFGIELRMGAGMVVWHRELYIQVLGVRLITELIGNCFSCGLICLTLRG